ncbi:MAG: acyl-CoA dehydrogenase family protein, partial [Cyanobacteria bacterium J06642_11]
MATDWEIHQQRDIPQEAWQYLKYHRFFGLLIPREYGGLGFSATGYGTVMTKLVSQSFVYGATVGGANTLGPTRLLLHSGTEIQKQYYLPRLAIGREIPCFVMMETENDFCGTGARSSGIIFKSIDDGELYLRLNWPSRTVALGAIATLIGLAIHLRDPDNLLDKGTNLGITCVLVPTNTPGVSRGYRHDPMGVPFYYSPIAGRNVVLPVSQIIGGIEQAGQGVEAIRKSLYTYGGINFSSTCMGLTKLVSRVTSAHRVIQEQNVFIKQPQKVPALAFARLGSLTYAMDAAHQDLCSTPTEGITDIQQEPSTVIAAIAQHTLPSIIHNLLYDGLQSLGKAGICRGPNNLLASLYMATPLLNPMAELTSSHHHECFYHQSILYYNRDLIDVITGVEDN